MWRLDHFYTPKKLYWKKKKVQKKWEIKRKKRVSRFSLCLWRDPLFSDFSMTLSLSWNVSMYDLNFWFLSDLSLNNDAAQFKATAVGFLFNVFTLFFCTISTLHTLWHIPLWHNWDTHCPLLFSPLRTTCNLQLIHAAYKTPVYPLERMKCSFTFKALT